MYPVGARTINLRGSATEAQLGLEFEDEFAFALVSEFEFAFEFESEVEFEFALAVGCWLWPDLAFAPVYRIGRLGLPDEISYPGYPPSPLPP